MTVGELLSYHEYNDDILEKFNRIVIVDNQDNVLETITSKQQISEYQHLYVSNFYCIYYGLIVVVKK